MSDEKQKPEEHEDVGLYQKLADRVADLVQEGRKTLDDALKKASAELSSGGDYTKEKADKIAEYLRRDLEEFGSRANKAGETMLDATEPHRIVAGVQSGLARLLTTAADALGEWAEKSEKGLAYKTGEVTSPGTLTCKGCGKELHFKSTVRIPPCPQCHKTEFRKSY
jgi:NAD-dependent SIR2 family protein deacetylase